MTYHDCLYYPTTPGHPDVFDRMSAITMGGVSKASKGIHLSEDIFAGFNYVLRGGEATQADYIQVWRGVVSSCRVWLGTPAVGLGSCILQLGLFVGWWIDLTPPKQRETVRLVVTRLDVTLLV